MLINLGMNASKLLKSKTPCLPAVVGTALQLTHSELPLASLAVVLFLHLLRSEWFVVSLQFVMVAGS